MAKTASRSHFVVINAQNKYDRVFNSLADGERAAGVSPKVLKKVLEGTPVTKQKALQVAKAIWQQDRSLGEDPLSWVKDVRSQ
ncbi:MAG: hypothetical protein AAGA15_03375 [Pseudomonadota bacterium]